MWSVCVCVCVCVGVQIKKMQVDRDNLIQDNEDQAAINLSHEPELQEGWTALQEKVASWLAGVSVLAVQLT